MEFIILDLANVTEEQLIAALDCNNRTARLMSSEIEKLKRVAASARKTSQNTDEEPLETEELPAVISPVDEDFENEVDYYNSALKELTLKNVEAKIQETLPSRKNYNFQRIMLRIKAEILRNLKDIKDFLAGEGVTLDQAEEFKEEVLLEQTKLKLIDKHLSQKEEQTKEEKEPENNLIFVPTTGGNIRVLDEIEHIDPVYYDRFLGLFQSIKDGTFKNVQRFSRNSDLAGLCEVKDFKTRVVFVRLNNDSYAIISAFIKKTDNDKGYRNMLSSRYSDYQTVESNLLANLDNEEFMNLQKEYEQELLRKLSPYSPKNAQVVKTKVGDE